ncbi:MAG: sugar phosphate isomerase/epimerase family protein [Pseudomonadota bacterium]
MKPEIGFVGLLSTKQIIDDIRFAVDNGFQWYELALDWPQNFEISEQRLSEIRETSLQNKLKLVIHTAYYLPMAVPIPEIQDAVVTNLKTAINIAAKVGSDRVTVHPGLQQLPAGAASAGIDALIGNLRRAVDFGAKYGVHICLENFPKGGHSLCASLKTYSHVLNKIPDISATLDVGHVNTTDESPVEYLSTLKNFILDMHIHDNNGKTDEHKCLTEGTLDFYLLLRKCKELLFKGPFMLEMFPYENILRGRDIFMKMWEDG